MTIVALFDHFEGAKAAIADIVNAGTPRDRISLLANDWKGEHPGLIGNPAFAREEVDEKSEEQSHTFVGAEVGVGLGGVLGLLAGVGTLALPGIGPLIAAGIWATVGAGAVGGGIVGGVIGALTEHGISDKDAHLYAEGLRRGGTLLTVRVPENGFDGIADILKKHGAVDIEKRGGAWLAEGWMSFDPEAPTLSAEQMAAMRASADDHAVEHHHAIRHYFHPQDGLPLSGGASNVTTHYGEDELRG
jgi:hypothetical protein